MEELFAAGANYRIVLEGAVARCVVWSRPDLSSEEGAACAEEKIAHFQKLSSTAEPRAMILDLEQAPAVTGPRTQLALASLLLAFEQAGKPVAVVVGTSPTQQMQLARLIEENAPRHGKVVSSMLEATQFVG